MKLERIAFMSYVHENDVLDKYYLTRFRERLEGQISQAIGEDFTIFQDRVHINPGHQWEARIEQYLSKSTFLIPILTPHFFNSEWCRKEFEYFRSVEQRTGLGQRIIPVYYIKCRELENHSAYAPESMEWLIHTYHYADWRDLRTNNAGINTTPAVKQLRRIATYILERLNELESAQPGVQDTSSPGGTGPSRSVPVASNDSIQNPPFDLQILPYPKRVLGRGREVARVIAGLTSPSGSQIVSISGIAAIGKTTVAAVAMRRLFETSSFPGGIAVVPCAGITDPLIALRDALTRFDSERRPPAMRDEAGLAEEAHRLLHKKQALIVLDDVEANVDVVRVVDLLHEAGAALLLTSKRRLRLPKATSFTLKPLDKPDALDLLTPPPEDER
jgi:hypothetical protein